MKNKQEKIMLMHPISGHVQSQEDWRAEFDLEGWPEEDFETLIWVIYDKENECWVEKYPSKFS